MSEPTDENLTKPTDEVAAEPADEESAEPADEEAADYDSFAGKHRSSDRQPRTRWVAPVALLIALIALAGVAWALFLPSWLPSLSNRSSATVADSNTSATTSATSARFTDQQVADAKGRACAAFNSVSLAVAVQTHNDVGKDPVAILAVAGNARLAMIGGGQYLLERLDPATPAQIADAIRAYGGQLQEIGVYAMAGSPNDDPAQDARRRDIETANAHITDLCK